MVSEYLLKQALKIHFVNEPATSETFTFVNYQERLKLFEILWICTMILKQLTKIKILHYKKAAIASNHELGS